MKLKALNKESVFTFLLGCLFYFFSNCNYTIPLASWLTPILLIRFVRTQDKKRSITYLFIVLVLLSFIQWKGIIHAPGILFYLIAFLNTTILFIPYILDRAFYKRFSGLLGTLIFPLSYSIIEFSTSGWGLHGTWGALAYTQRTNVVLLQLLSITGIYGISFLIGWTGTIMNWLWEKDFQFKSIKRGMSIYLLILIFILSYGSIRYYFLSNHSKTVRISSIAVPQEIDALDNKALLDVVTHKHPSSKNIKLVKQYCDTMIEKLFEKTRKEAASGSKIILWSEMNASLFKQDEPAFLKKSSDVAKEEHIYLMVSYAGLVKPGDPYVENKIAVFNPKGSLLLHYMKTKIPPGDKNKVGKGNLQTFDTPYGKIGAVICYEEEFPGFVHQLAKKKIDILLIPKQDWDQIVPLHSYQGYMRGIENGFATVQGVYNGLSLATDYKGNVLSKVDYHSSRDKVMVSEVPTKGVTTIYQLIGDTFAWTCAVALFILLGSGIIRSSSIKRSRNRSMVG